MSASIELPPIRELNVLPALLEADVGDWDEALCVSASPVASVSLVDCMKCVINAGEEVCEDRVNAFVVVSAVAVLIDVMGIDVEANMICEVRGIAVCV